MARPARHRFRLAPSKLALGGKAREVCLRYPAELARSFVICHLLLHLSCSLGSRRFGSTRNAAPSAPRTEFENLGIRQVGMVSRRGCDYWGRLASAIVAAPFVGGISYGQPGLKFKLNAIPESVISYEFSSMLGEAGLLETNSLGGPAQGVYVYVYCCAIIQKLRLLCNYNKMRGMFY